MKYALYVRKQGVRDLILEKLNDYERSQFVYDTKLDFLGFVKGTNLSFDKDKSGFTIVTAETYKLNKK